MDSTKNNTNSVSPSATQSNSKKLNILLVLSILVVSGALLYLIVKSKKTDRTLARLERGRQQNLSDVDVVDIIRAFIFHPENRNFLGQCIIPLLPEPDPVYIPRPVEVEEEEDSPPTTPQSVSDTQEDHK